jgi:flagellar FliL protein
VNRTKEGLLMASKDEEQVKEKAGKKSNTILFVVIGAVLMTAILAGVGIFLFTGESKGGSQKTAKVVTPETLAVFSLDPFIVNIYDGQDLRYLKLRVEMELSDAESKTELTARQAQIRDAILSILTTKTYQDLQYLQGKNQLKQEIMAAVTRIVTPGKVKQIYFTDFVVQ